MKRFSTRPRLSVFRSHKHIYAQVIDDSVAKTLAAASSRDEELRDAVSYGGNKAAAAAVGQLVAKRALAAGVKQVAFDRRSYRYHGRVAALADAARDAGLDLGAKPEAPAEEAAPKKAAKGGKQPSGKQASGKKKQAADAESK